MKSSTDQTNKENKENIRPASVSEILRNWKREQAKLQDQNINIYESHHELPHVYIPRVNMQRPQCQDDQIYELREELAKLHQNIDDRPFSMNFIPGSYNLEYEKVMSLLEHKSQKMQRDAKMMQISVENNEIKYAEQLNEDKNEIK